LSSSKTRHEKGSRRFVVVELNADYYLSGDLPPMPIDSSFDVYVNGGYVASLVMSPSWVEEAVIGFLVGEGMVSFNGIKSLTVSRESKVVSVEVEGFKGRRKFFFDDCVALMSQASKVKSELKVPITVLEELYMDFEFRSSEKQGVQVTGVYDLRSMGGVVAYDVSRYSSLAKALGYAIKHNFNVRESMVITTGRASGDLIVMTANTGIPIVVTTKNPIYSGYIAAITYRVTLVIALRKGDDVILKILTYPERVVMGVESLIPS